MGINGPFWKKGEILENGQNECSEGGGDFGHMPDFVKFTGERQKDVNKVNLLKRTGKLTPRKRILRYKI